MVDQGRDLRVRIGADKAAGELVAFLDLDQPGIIFRAPVAKRQQLFQHDGDLDPVGGGQGIELQRMFADRQVLVMGRAGYRPVDAGELTAIGLFPGPDFWRGVGGVTHEAGLRHGAGFEQKRKQTWWTV